MSFNGRVARIAELRRRGRINIPVVYFNDPEADLDEYRLPDWVANKLRTIELGRPGGIGSPAKPSGIRSLGEGEGGWPALSCSAPLGPIAGANRARPSSPSTRPGRPANPPHDIMGEVSTARQGPHGWPLFGATRAEPRAAWSSCGL
jgi:hypothetical protein